MKTKASEANAPVFDLDLSGLHIEEAVARLPLPMIQQDIVLFVRPATSDNKPFQNAVQRASKGKRLVTAIGAQSTDEAGDRRADLKIYARHIVKGWEGVKNKAGVGVPFNEDNLLVMFDGMPDWLFDRIRLFCMSPESFVDDTQGIPENPDELAGN